MTTPEGGRADWLAARLAAGGCVAPEEEAADLREAAAGNHDVIESLLAKRLSGLPLAWVTGFIDFGGVRLTIDEGVYVPRHETVMVAERAAELLPERGSAVDLCTGSGAVAALIAARRPGATVLATEIDPVAVRCATANGVRVLQGDLDEPLPDTLAGNVDVVTAVVPYVPADSLAYLPREHREHEPMTALCGGTDGMEVLSRALSAAGRLLRPGGHLVAEVGGDQCERLAPVLKKNGFAKAVVLRDEEGDVRGVTARREPL